MEHKIPQVSLKEQIDKMHHGCHPKELLYRVYRGKSTNVLPTGFQDTKRILVGNQQKYSHLLGDISVQRPLRGNSDLSHPTNQSAGNRHESIPTSTTRFSDSFRVFSSFSSLVFTGKKE